MFLVVSPAFEVVGANTGISRDLDFGAKSHEVRAIQLGRYGWRVEIAVDGNQKIWQTHQLRYGSLSH